MNYQVLARKWRPQTFNDVVGQTHIVKTLTNAIEKGRTAHAYLFSGSRGLGKTSLARILAKGLNCEHGPTASPCNNCSMCIEIISATSVDVVEIDGASNTGVDDIRELKEDVRYIPLKGRYKIYIIDEVHMLSNSAFNALLKTLEEPPPHVIFIFATTEAHKIPQTILSRCQHFNFKRITYQEIMERLGFVAGKEGISLDERSSSIIARSSEGSMRDALILLDQVVSYCGKDVRQNDIETVLGLVGRERLSGFTNAIAGKDAKIGLELIKALVDNSIDIRVFSKEYVEYVRDLLIARVVEAPDHLIERPKENIELIKKEAGLFSLDELQRLFAIFQQAHDEIARSGYPRFVLEIALIKAVKLRPLKPIEDIVQRLSEIERLISTDEIKNSKGAEAGKIEDKKGGSKPEALTGEAPAEERLQADNRQAGREALAPPAAEPVSWGQILTAIGERRPNLRSYLEKGVLLNMTNSDITIGFDEGSSFLAELLNREENIAFIGAVVKDLSGRDRRIKITKLSGNDISKEGFGSAGSEGESPGRQRSNKDQIVIDALNILGGEVVDTRRLEGGK